MRNFKFRAWDSINNKWLLGYEYPNLGGFSMFGEVMMGGEWTQVLNSFRMEDWNKIILMQSTGFKNKNGVEVYEGDLFRQEKETDHGDIRSYLVVMWIRQRAAYYLIPVEHRDVLLDNDVSDEPEFEWLFQDAALYDFSIDVGLDPCGNIYQNPELL